MAKALFKSGDIAVLVTPLDDVTNVLGFVKNGTCLRVGIVYDNAYMNEDGTIDSVETAEQKPQVLGVRILEVDKKRGLITNVYDPNKTQMCVLRIAGVDEVQIRGVMWELYKKSYLYTHKGNKDSKLKDLIDIILSAIEIISGGKLDLTDDDSMRTLRDVFQSYYGRVWGENFKSPIDLIKSGELSVIKGFEKSTNFEIIDILYEVLVYAFKVMDILSLIKK